MKQCKVKDCSNKYNAKGYCHKHYLQIWVHGKILKRTTRTPNEFIDRGDYCEIILYNAKCIEVDKAIIDKEDLEKCKQYKWYLNGRGYVMTTIKGRKILLHRFVNGRPLKGKVTDHKDTNPLNNRKSNLRFITQQQNTMNRKNVKGYHWHKRYKKWRAMITTNQKIIYLGSFTNKQNAIKARKQAEIKYFGEYAYNSND